MMILLQHDPAFKHHENSEPKCRLLRFLTVDVMPSPSTTHFGGKAAKGPTRKKSDEEACPTTLSIIFLMFDQEALLTVHVRHKLGKELSRLSLPPHSKGRLQRIVVQFENDIRIL